MIYYLSVTNYKLGYSISWRVVNSHLHFSKSVRLNIVINTYLRGMLKYFRSKLVKWIGNVEWNYFKLSLVISSKSHPKHYKFIGRSKILKFIKRNYLYSEEVSLVLRDLYTKHHFRPKFKFFRSVYFILKKLFRYIKNLFKNYVINTKFFRGKEKRPDDEKKNQLKKNQLKKNQLKKDN